MLGAVRLGPVERGSASLVAVGVLLPLVAVVPPSQPIRAIAAAGLLLLVPGLAVARLLRLGDPILFVVVALSTSLALSVLAATGLMYAGIWSWQLTLVLLGLITATVAAATGLSKAPP
jgi:hypothetical protein